MHEVVCQGIICNSRSDWIQRQCASLGIVEETMEHPHSGALHSYQKEGKELYILIRSYLKCILLSAESKL